MTDRATLTARIIPAVAAAALTAARTARTMLQPAPGQRAAGTRPAPSSPAPERTTAAATPGLAALLPASPAWIEAAVGLAARFAAAYATYSYYQPPAAYLARLRPMVTSQLYRALAQAAETPGILAQRDRGHLAVTATVTAGQIRDLTPGSVIIAVQVRQVTTTITTSGHSHISDDLAVTVIRDGSSQAVYDVEPAGAGNTGGSAADALSP
jgi:hypothetical protein